jgi:HPt (histidine-containing phosphotransfer) domain-containing protein
MKSVAPSSFTIDPDIEDLIPAFLAARATEAIAIERHLTRGAFSAIGSLAHGIKGSGSSYGFPLISSIGQDLEDAALEKNTAKVLQSMTRLKSYLASVELELRLHYAYAKPSVIS